MINRPQTVLFVDDEPWLSEPLRLALEGRGITCFYEKDATAALQRLRQEAISVLVTDIMMPSGDEFKNVDSSEAGFHLVKKVRKDWPHVSIICLSVIGDRDKIEALKRENVLYLRKGETPLETAVNLIRAKVTGLSRF